MPFNDAVAIVELDERMRDGVDDLEPGVRDRAR
jgi:hypothetical protein